MKKLVLLLAFIVAACLVPDVPPAPVPRGSPPLGPIPVSPLPHPPVQAMSPLPAPGRVGAPSIVVVRKAYLPLAQSPIVAEFLPCAQNETSLRMAVIFATAAWQRRINPRCEPLLALAAQRKAEDFARYDYAAHMSLIGVSPNQNVRNTGYALPDWYAKDANNVESFAAGYQTVEEVYAAWSTSFLHWQHVSGSAEFFRLQTCYGTGAARTDAPGFHYFYVLISAPCQD